MAEQKYETSCGLTKEFLQTLNGLKKKFGVPSKQMVIQILIRNNEIFEREKRGKQVSQLQLEGENLGKDLENIKENIRGIHRNQLLLRGDFKNYQNSKTK